MNKKQFIDKLKSGIKDIPKDEQENIIAYYEEYFEDADNEEKAIEDLGSVSKIITQLKGEYALKSIEEKISVKKEINKEIEKVKERGGEVKGDNSNFKNILFVLLAILAAPIATPLAIALFAIICAFVIALVAVSISLIVAIVAVGIGCITVFIAGIIKLFTVFPLGLLLIGVSLVISSVSIIVFSALLCVCKFAVYGLFKVVKRIVKRG